MSLAESEPGKGKKRKALRRTSLLGRCEWDVIICESNVKKQGIIKVKEGLVHIAIQNSEREEIYPPGSFAISPVSEITIILKEQTNNTLIEFQSPKKLHEFMRAQSVQENSPKQEKQEKTILGGFTKMIDGFKEKISGSSPSVQPPNEPSDSKNQEILQTTISYITINLAKAALFSKAPYTLYESPVSDGMDLVSSKGELGCLPVFSTNYRENLHKTHVPKWPQGAIASLVSENWTNNTAEMWKEIKIQFQSKLKPDAIFDFEWRGINESELTQWYSSIHSCNTPIHFELTNRVAWKMIYGSYTPGTCYRKAENTLRRNDKWLSNAISNFYKVELFRSQNQETEPQSLVNMYRHGIIGFKQTSIAEANHLTPQVFLIVSKAIETQRQMCLPPRIVSHNLVNQTKLFGTLNKERNMLQRHETVFTVALQMALQQGYSEGSCPTSLAHFYLPTNTDKNVLSLGDSEAGINNRSSLLYLRWVCEDCCDLFSKLVVPSEERDRDYCRAQENLNFRDSRWKNSLESNVLGDISLSSLENDLIAQIPFEEPLIRKLLTPQRTNSWISLCNALLFEITEKESILMYSNTAIPHSELQSFLRVTTIILSSLGVAIFQNLEFLDSLSSNELQNLHEDVQRCRISVNLLRVLYHSEVFVHRRKEETDFSQREGVIGVRKFTRVTSLLVAGLLDYCLGACVFVNCKSGLDRTGLFVGLHNSLVTLWELYPKYRWELHLVCINYNSLRALVLGGKFKISEQTQPPSPLTQASTEEFNIQYRDLVNILSGKEPKNIPQNQKEDVFEGKKETSASEYLNQAAWDFRIGKVLYEDDLLSGFGFPMFFLIRNYILAFLVDVNSLITYASTGLRGMKYRNHLIAGPLLPSFASTLEGEIINIIRRSPTISGGGIADYLTDNGNDLLVDLAMHRKS